MCFITCYCDYPDWSSGAVVEAACLESRSLRVRTPHWPSNFNETKWFSLVKIQYSGEPLWQRGGVLGLRPPGHEFRVLFVESSVIPFISPSPEYSPGPVYPICARRWPKTPFIHSFIHSFIHLFIHSFIHSFNHSFNNSFVINLKNFESIYWCMAYVNIKPLLPLDWKLFINVL